MIKEIKIRNFQSHKRTTISFSDKVNAIVGPSDCGKSAILRALRWVLFNDQAGEAFRAHDSERTAVTLSTENIDIMRLRSNKDNSYSIDDHDSDSKLFEKVRGEVPEEISKILNMDLINVQTQMDAPFLLSESPAEVGRILNKAAGIDDIDKSMSKINTMERENSKELGIRNKDLADADKELALYRGLERIDADVCAVEKVYKILTTTQGSIRNINTTLEELEKVEIKIDALKPLAKISLDEALELQKELQITTENANSLEDLLASLSKVEENIESAEIITMQSIILHEALSIQNELNENEQDIKNLKALLVDIGSCGEDVESKEDELNTLTEKFNKLMPSVCPLCEQEI